MNAKNPLIIPKQFIFRANASALCARIRRPDDLYGCSDAKTCLSGVGGNENMDDGTTLGRKYLWHGAAKEAPEISYDRSTASSTGDFTDLKQAIEVTNHTVAPEEVPAQSVVKSGIYGLEVFKRLKVAVAEGGLVSDCRTPLEETEVIPRDCRIEGVSLDGHELAIKLDVKPFTDHNTHAKVAQVFSAESPQGIVEVSRQGTQIYCTIVAEMKWVGEPHPDAKIEGHTLTIPDFGVVYFGELIVSPSARRLRMVRAAFGSRVGGAMLAGEVETNGGYCP